MTQQPKGAVTPADIARLRELLAKATPGPWVSESDLGGDYLYSNETRRVILGEDYSSTCLPSKETYALIVEAVNALPAILDRLEKLERFVADVDSGKIACDNFVNCGVEDAAPRLDP